MAKRWFMNLALAIVLVALALLAWFRPGTEATPSKPTITTLKPAAVTRIRIAQPNQKTAVFKRIDGQWRMIAPVSARAAGRTIRNWLATMRETSSQRYSVRGLNLEALGLEPPKLVLTLNRQKLAFGDFDPLNHQRYIRRGDTVYLVNDLLFFQLNGDPLSFASKRLLPADVKIAALILPKLKLTRTANGNWQLTPPRPRIASDQIQKLIDAWRRARAVNVKSIGAAKAVGNVVVRLQDSEKTIRFQILKADSKLILARPKLGIEYRMRGEQRKTLLKLSPAKGSIAAGAAGGE
jgi:hypothetical protein